MGDVLTMDATVLVGALQALKLDHYGRKKRSATAVAEPWVGSYGYGGYGGYGRKRRDAEPLSALDILTMDSTVLVQALQDLGLDHYGRKKREADPLSVLDILTMDATVLVGALLDQNLDHYGRK